MIDYHRCKNDFYFRTVLTLVPASARRRISLPGAVANIHVWWRFQVNVAGNGCAMRSLVSVIILVTL